MNKCSVDSKLLGKAACRCYLSRT